ncbi:MAG: helix-turn-helix domain-containing protein [Pseudonocardiaceae bacterium]
MSQDDHGMATVDAFIAELRHWREVTGYSQKALAKLVGYTPSYVSKVERGPSCRAGASPNRLTNISKPGAASCGAGRTCKIP